MLLRPNLSALSLSFHTRFLRQGPVGRLLLAGLLLIVIAFNAGAVDKTWVGANNGAWLTSGNWSPSGAATNTDRAIFAAGNTAATIGFNMNTLHGVENVGGILMSGGGVDRAIGDSSTTINGVLTVVGLSGVAIQNTSANALTIRDTVSGTGTVTMGLAFGAGNPAIDVSGTGNVNISSIITGANGFTKTGSGPGLLTVSNSSSLTGPVIIGGGTLKLGPAGAFPSAQQISVLGGATFDVSAVSGSFTLASGEALVAGGGAFPATNLTDIGKGLTISPGTLVLTNFNGTTPSLAVAGAGSINMTAGDNIAVYVSHSGIPLAAGDYTLITNGLGNTTAVAGSAPSLVPIGGDGVLGTGSLILTNGTLLLHVVGVGGSGRMVVTLPGQTFVSGTGNTGSPTAVIAGTPFNLTLTAVMSDGVTKDASYTGTHTISYSGPSGSPSFTTSVSFNNGQATGVATTLFTAETTTITANDVAALLSGLASSSFVVNPGAISSYVVAASSPQANGIPFDVSVTAMDAFNNLVTTDNSTVVTMTSDTGNVLFDSNTNGVFGEVNDNKKTLSHGMFAISAEDPAGETVTITATDANSKTGASGSITVNFLARYRSKQTGVWNDFSTWQVDTTGSGYVDASSGQTPKSSDSTIEIQNSQVVTVTNAVAADQIIVDPTAQVIVASNVTWTISDGPGTDLDVFGTVTSSGGTIAQAGSVAFESGSRYQHNRTGGSIPIAVWNSNSTCEVNGMTTTAPSSGLSGQVFGNLLFDSVQKQAIGLGGPAFTVNGSLIVATTGGFELRIANSQSPTINLAGDLTVSNGAMFVLGDAGGNPLLNIAGNISVGSGGSFNTFFDGSVTFVKAGVQTITNAGTIAGPFRWTVASGSTLDIGSSFINSSNVMMISSGGALRGNGALGGDLIVSNGAALTAGEPVGTLIVSGTTTLQGSTIIAIDKAASTHGGLFTSNIVYGGTLVISNLSTALALNDSFTLFPALGYSGAFNAIVPATPGVGLAWNTNSLSVDGSLKVVAAVVTGPSTNVSILTAHLAGTNLLIHGTNNNVPNTSFHYAILASTNLTTPLSNWSVLTTNNFNPNGTFDYTNPIVPGKPRQFIDVEAVP